MSDHRTKPGSPGDILEHYGVKGMKWGFRKSDGPSGVPHKTNKMARSDAEEFTKAKLYYGEGAGTRRKLIKAKVDERSKDPLYKKAFDYHVEKTDMAKRAKQAQKKRKRVDRTATVKKTARKSGLNDIVREAAVRNLLEQSDHTSEQLEGAERFVERFIEHYGVKGMRWGVRNEDKPVGRSSDGRLAPSKIDSRKLPKSESNGRTDDGKLSTSKSLSPDTQQRIARVTRTDSPQVLGASRAQGDKHGLTNEQKTLIAFGAAGAAAAGYFAYKHYVGGTMPGLDLEKIKQEQQILEGMKLPKSWDVSGLRNGPISTQRLGDLAAGNVNLKLLDADNLVINTARGYADILPKDGFSNPFAAEQHASVTRVLEEMREKFPAIRNMNVEVVPMSKVPGVESSDAFMSVLAMRAGEARVMYNDTMSAPDAAMISANRSFLPGLGKKDYIAYHEMGHLLTVAHGELPPAFDLVSGNGSPAAWRTWQKADPLLHKQQFARHGFSFKELSKLSRYAATEPAEAMAELVGHYFQPEMRQRLTPDQVRRAEGMINEMGGLVS